MRLVHDSGATFKPKPDEICEAPLSVQLLHGMKEESKKEKK